MSYQPLVDQVLSAEETYDSSAKTDADKATFKDVLKQVTNKLTSKEPTNDRERAAAALGRKANDELKKDPANLKSATIYLTRGPAGGLRGLDMFYGTSGGKRRKMTKRQRRKRMTRRRR